MAPNNPNTAPESEKVKRGSSSGSSRTNEGDRNIPASQQGSSVGGNQVVSIEMCFFCFDVLYNHLNGKKHDTPNFTNEEFPLFVTWKIGSDKRLRGCTGTFFSTPLHRGLSKFALVSALKDSRFQPVTRNELKELHVSVSLLLNFEEGRDYLDWTVGVHGIRIEYHDERGNFYSSTFLPEVAPEQNWDQQETINALLRKGGYHGTINEEVCKNIRLTRYTSEKLSLSFQDWATSRAIVF